MEIHKKFKILENFLELYIYLMGVMTTQLHQCAILLHVYRLHKRTESKLLKSRAKMNFWQNFRVFQIFDFISTNVTLKNFNKSCFLLPNDVFIGIKKHSYPLYITILKKENYG